MTTRHLLALAACSLGVAFTSCGGGGSVPDGTELTLVYAGNNIGEIEPCG